MSVSGISSTQQGYTPAASAASSQRRTDFKSLVQSLQSGDLSGAQQAFSSLQQDFAARSSSSATSSTSSAGSSRADDLKAIGTALQAGDMSAAQQAFAKLQQDSQGAGHGHGHHHHHQGGSATQAPAASVVNVAGAPVQGIDTTA